MQRCGEAAIRRPPIPHQDAVEVRTQHLGRFVEATPRTNPIHRGLRGRERPQPVPHRTDAPAGFVGADHGTAADLLAQRGVGRGGHAGGAMQHVHEASGRHGQPEALPQERRHLRERHADFFVQARHQRDGARPHVDVGGPDRVRGLQGMAALHAASTLCALPDGHIKAPDDRLDEGKIFLILRRDAPQIQCPATPRTRRGTRGRVRRIDAGGNRASGPPPRLPAAALGPILGERRGLPEPGPSRGRELLLQPFVLPRQPIVRTSQPIRAHVAPDRAHAAPDPVHVPCAPPPPATARPLRRGGDAVRHGRRRWHVRVHRPREIYGRLAPKVQVQNCNHAFVTR